MLSTTTASSILNMLTGKSSNYSSSSFYIGLLSAEPGTNGSINSGSEPFNYGNYARVLIGYYNNTSSQIMTVSADSTNGGAYATNSTTSSISGYIMFPETKDSAYPNAITHFAIFTSATSGNAILWGNLVDDSGEATSITVAQSTVPLFRPENLKITLK